MASSLAYAGYILALIGGIIIIIEAILAIIGSPFLAGLTVLGAIGALVSGIIRLIIGLVCIAGSRYVSSLTWAIILLVLGIIAGGIGGVLVVIGAILGLLSRL